MELRFSEEGRQDFLGLDKTLQSFFKKHIEKISEMPPRRHLKLGIPYHVENVTKQARLVYDADENMLLVVRCFAAHKEYEKWYKSYK